MVIHVPHASWQIPDRIRNQYILSDDELKQEQIRLTDAYVDELFQRTAAHTVVFPYSRLVVDVERFSDDAQEPMSNVGMGRFYTKTTDGHPLRRALQSAETAELERWYSDHHSKLTAAVEDELQQTGQCLLIDCHSFPSMPLPCDQDQTQPRPDFCIGTDDFHTPKDLVKTAIQYLEQTGFSVAINRPYAGTLVPLKFYGNESRVSSIMIECNRRLYLDERSAEKCDDFGMVAVVLQQLLDILDRTPLCAC